MKRFILVATFGMFGVSTRYLINSIVAVFMNLGFPVATIAINIVGSFLIGLTYVAFTQTIVVNEDIQIAIMAGFLGGFTTFSAFSLESVSLFAEGHVLLSALYVAGSVGGGISATLLGLYIGKHVFI